MAEGIAARTEVSVAADGLVHPLAEGIADSVLEVEVVHSLAENIELCEGVVFRQALALRDIWHLSGPVDEELACVEILEV